AGWAALPASSVCAGGSALLVGDWDGEKKPDAGAVAPGDMAQVRMRVLHNSGSAFQVISTGEQTVCARWPLTGLPLAGGSANERPLYVKIDNNPHARPHYGISKADEVYEWLVEGLTTRLAAVFQSQKPDVIGAVRSARITDTPIAPSLGAAFVYSGGGPEELMRLHYDDAVPRRRRVAALRPVRRRRPRGGRRERPGDRRAEHHRDRRRGPLHRRVRLRPGGQPEALHRPHGHRHWRGVPRRPARGRHVVAP